MKEFEMPTKEAIIEAIEIAAQNCYSREDCEECGWDLNKMEHPDATQWDNAIIIEKLNGWAIHDAMFGI